MSEANETASEATPVVLITGAAGGVGSALAHHFFARGFGLALQDRGCDREGHGEEPERLEQLVRSLLVGVRPSELRSRTPLVAHGDIAAPGAARALVDRVRERFGRLDAVVSATGIRRDRSLLRLADEDVAATFAAGYLGPLALLRAAAGAWVEAGEPGAVVLMGSPTATFGAARQSQGAASAAALAAAARSVALELRRFEIRVNVVAPTARTRQTEDLPLFRSVKEGSLRAADVAPLVEFLVSDAGRAVSGEVLGVAGGRVYALQGRETPGAFAAGAAFEVEELAASWDEVIRG